MCNTLPSQGRCKPITLTERKSSYKNNIILIVTTYHHWPKSWRNNFFSLCIFEKYAVMYTKRLICSTQQKTKNTLAQILQINVATARPTCFRVSKLHSANTVRLFVLSVSQNKFCPLKVQLFTPTVACLKYYYILLDSPKHLRSL